MDRVTNMMTFIKVVQSGSFSEAARRLAVSNAVVTKRIKQLEDLLNVRLLQRSTRSLSVTDSGLAFYDHCVRIVADVEDTEADFTSMGLEPRGHLRISCPASFAISWLNTDICEFQHRYPGVTIELVHNERAVNPVTEGYDLCLQFLPVYADSVERQPIASTRRLVVASPEYLRRNGEPDHPSLLQHHSCVRNTLFAQQSQWVFQGQDGVVSAPLNPTMLTNSAWLSREAALHGNCIAILPVFFIVKELDEGLLIPILSAYNLKDHWCYAYYPKNRHTPLKTKMFLDLLASRYGENYPWEEKTRKGVADVR